MGISVGDTEDEVNKLMNQKGAVYEGSGIMPGSILYTLGSVDIEVNYENKKVVRVTIDTVAR